MKEILLFGAGKSSTVLIDYLSEHAMNEKWEFTVVDSDIQLAKSKIKDSKSGRALAFDITNAEERKKSIQKSNLVISLLPPTLHYLVAQDCIEFGKDLLMASYVDDRFRDLEEKMKEKNILFLCEMGLDPGIDHMSAMQIIDEIHSKGGNITSFKSHCGGLVAPESDDNPWHYKISWNPRNIVLAGKAGAVYKENDMEKHLLYEELFTTERIVNVPGIGSLCWYPNRDSLNYISLYGLQSATTFIRTTLRHQDFMYGWKNVVDLKLTDEKLQYQTDGKSLALFFKEHMDKNGFEEWLQQKLMERFSQTKDLLQNLMNLLETEKEAEDEGEAFPKSLMVIDDGGKLEDIKMDEVKSRAADVVALKLHEANLTLKQLFFLGMDDEKTMIDEGLCSAADVLQMALEMKLALLPGDRDMIVLLHEIEYEVQGLKYGVKSSLVVKGEDSLHTAMAKTVGLPLGIAARLILNGKIKLTGLHIPTIKEIYEPVLAELEGCGIKFEETTNRLDTK